MYKVLFWLIGLAWADFCLEKADQFCSCQNINDSCFFWAKFSQDSQHVFCEIGCQEVTVTHLPAQSTPITARPAEVVSVRSAAGLAGDSKTGRGDKQKTSLIRVNGTMERPVVVNVSAAEQNKREVLAARSAPATHHKLKQKVKTPSSWPVVQPTPVMLAEEEQDTARLAEDVVRPHDRVAPVAEQGTLIKHSTNPPNLARQQTTVGSHWIDTSEEEVK